MGGDVVLPVWAGVVAAIGTPVLAFLGVLLANRVNQRGVVELESRSQREETMRNLRWAAELAVSPDPGKADLGLRELQALSGAADEEQQVFIDAALESVYALAEDAVEVATEEGYDVVVEVAPGPDAERGEEPGHGPDVGVPWPHSTDEGDRT